MTPLHRLGMDFLIPWTTPLRSPHASSRNMLHHLKKFGRVRYYSLYEKGVIHLKPQDVFIGQPVAEGGFSMDTRPDRDDPQSITSQTLRANKDNHNKFLIVPFANDALLMSWVKDLALHHADKVILIGGEIWTKDWTHNVFSEIDRKKILRIDNAVDSKEYYPIKKEFNPPGKRKFLYIGHTGWYKNTQELEHIAARMDTFEGGHIGGGAVKGWKQIDAFADFNAEFLKNLAKEYDIFVTVSTADAQATTIIENMCFGFPIACTPETGYEYPSIVKLDTKDTVANIRALTAMQNMPEAELRRLVEENYKVVERYHSWKTYVTAISNFMNL